LVVVCSGTDPTSGLRERVIAERLIAPDVDRLVALVLDIADARHTAWRRGEPDPFGLPLPPGLAGEPAGMSVVLSVAVGEDYRVSLVGGRHEDEHQQRQPPRR
jgi:hypothetical protein